MKKYVELKVERDTKPNYLLYCYPIKIKYYLKGVKWMRRIKNNGYKLSELGKLPKMKITILLISFFIGPFLVGVNNLFIRFIFFSTLFFSLLWIIRSIKGKEYPLNFKLILRLLMLSFTSAFIVIFVTGSQLYVYVLLFFIFPYLYAGGIILYYIINIFYMIGLKTIFPNEMHSKKSEQYISLKKLSVYIDLSQQKKYLSLTIFNLIVYFIFVFYLVLLVYKYLAINNEIDNTIILNWIAKQEYLTIFNGVSILSLMITIYTITFPILHKIITDARNKYNEDNHKYIKLMRRNSDI